MKNLGDPLEDPLEHPSHFSHVFFDSGIGAEPSSGTEVFFWGEAQGIGAETHNFCWTWYVDASGF